jgi:hypothetical protein
MTAGLIVALVIAVPLILLPVAFVWYLNIGGLVAWVREGRKEQATEKEGAEAAVAKHRA